MYRDTFTFDLRLFYFRLGERQRMHQDSQRTYCPVDAGGTICPEWASTPRPNPVTQSPLSVLVPLTPSSTAIGYFLLLALWGNSRLRSLRAYIRAPIYMGKHLTVVLNTSLSIFSIIYPFNFVFLAVIAVDIYNILSFHGAFNCRRAGNVAASCHRDHFTSPVKTMG